MIHRKFDKLKFTRTYVGGSKQRENEIFTEVQGTKEDNSECNWLEYRRIFNQYCDDTLNIILSWKRLTNILFIIFLLLAALISFINIQISGLLLILSAAFLLSFQYFKQKERKSLSEFDFSLDVILSEIEKQTGFEFNKN